MFQLNEEFLKELGLDQLPEDQRKPFLDHIYSELELRVGERLSQGLSDAQLDEFANIIDKVPGAVDTFLAAHAPQCQSDPMFARLVQATGVAVDDPRLKDEFAATKWLEVNRPDYRDVVAAVMEELKKEIIANRDAILGAMAQAPPLQQAPQQMQPQVAQPGQVQSQAPSPMQPAQQPMQQMPQPQQFQAMQQPAQPQAQPQPQQMAQPQPQAPSSQSDFDLAA